MNITIDRIGYIPAILAYVFIGLLVTILSFIVIYVSHKIYLLIYDNFPINSIMNIPNVPAKEEHNHKELRHANTNQSHRDAEGFAEKSTLRGANRYSSFDTKHESPSFSRKAAKTECDVSCQRSRFGLQFSTAFHRTALRIIVRLETTYLAFVIFETETQQVPTPRIVQFYDCLSSIPIGEVMQKCPPPSPGPSPSPQRRPK